MKQSIYIMFGFGLLLSSCTKELTSPLDSKPVVTTSALSKTDVSTLSLEQKRDLLVAISEEPMFRDY